MRRLHHLLHNSAQIFPDRTAIEDLKGQRISYKELDELSSKCKDRLLERGVKQGDRVGIYSHKSIEMVVSLIGILKANAAYVPVDPDSPPERNAFIMRDCLVRAVIIEKGLMEGFAGRLGTPVIHECDDLPGELLLIDGPGASCATPASFEDIKCRDEHDSLAYILYTSGSTGYPKGVKYSHKGALAFVDWCSEIFRPNENDVFASHAPFHFDLSIHDIYVSLKHGAKLVLIDEETGKQPMILARHISEKHVSIWYSTPTILTLLAKFGKLEQFDYSNLRYVLFAGEVFPIKHLRALKFFWKDKRYFNLYGPTETNVCTYFEVPPEVPEDRTEPYPIGIDCSHLKSRVFDDSGEEIKKGEEGELCVTGPIMEGYWNLQERNASVFLTDDSGTAWYRTGDIVIEQSDGNYIYVSRKDRMVKRRGYRVELGEIETALYKHPAVIEAAAVAVDDKDGGVLIKAFLTMSNHEEASIVKMKKFSSENLPAYMIPDRFAFKDSLPRTSTNKIDYQKLKEL